MINSSDNNRKMTEEDLVVVIVDLDQELKKKSSSYQIIHFVLISVSVFLLFVSFIVFFLTYSRADAFSIASILGVSTSLILWMVDGYSKLGINANFYKKLSNSLGEEIDKFNRKAEDYSLPSRKEAIELLSNRTKEIMTKYEGV